MCSLSSITYSNLIYHILRILFNHQVLNTKYYTHYIPTTRYRILDAVGSLLSFDIFTNPLLRDQLLFKAINLFAIGSPMAAYMVLSATKREVRMWCNWWTDSMVILMVYFISFRSRLIRTLLILTLTRIDICQIALNSSIWWRDGVWSVQEIVERITNMLEYNCNFYNIFHPMDGVAYRLEPFLIPGYEKATTPLPLILTFSPFLP